MAQWLTNLRQWLTLINCHRCTSVKGICQRLSNPVIRMTHIHSLVALVLFMSLHWPQGQITQPQAKRRNRTRELVNLGVITFERMLEQRIWEQKNTKSWHVLRADDILGFNYTVPIPSYLTLTTIPRDWSNLHLSWRDRDYPVCSIDET